MKKLLSLITLCGLLVFGVNANALSITPASSILTGNENNVPDILIAIQSTIGSAEELYKMDAGASSASGVLAGSYATSFNGDLSGGTISLIPGATSIVDPSQPLFFLVKDGKHEPAWYLFDLSLSGLNWNGLEPLQLSGFWPGQGSISHVALYGTSAPVPEPSTMLLLGSGIMGLAFFGRKRMNK